jgi:hypothetical protein
MQRLARNPHPTRRLGNRQSQVLLKDLAEQFRVDASARNRAIERSTAMKLCAGFSVIAFSFNDKPERPLPWGRHRAAGSCPTAKAS